MGTTRRQLLLAMAAAPLAGFAHAQGGIGRIIVPFAAGGAREMPARAIADEMAQELGQSWIIEAKPGAGGALGTSFVAHAAPDGKTLLMAASSHFVTAAMGARPFYDPVKDFVPVADIGNQSYILLINAELPVKNLAGFMAYVRARPGQCNYNSAGVGSSTHLAMASFLRTAGLRMEHIPFKGTQEAVTDLAGGRGQAMVVPTAGVSAYLHNPRLRIVGITAAKRSALLPQVPTMAEAGLPGFVFESWFGLLAPAGTPQAIVERINAAVNKAIALPVVRQRLANLGIEPGNLGVDSFRKLFLADRDVMTRLVKEAGISRD